MHPQIEKYLFQVGCQLKNLSAQQRDEEVQEIGQHLQALVEEGRERGLSETSAVKTALAQFGSYRKVGRDLNQAVLGREPLRLPKALSALTWVMIGQAALSLFSYAFMIFALPNTWTSLVQATGGVGGALWRASSVLFFFGISLTLALSLRRLRPWAFWTTFIFISYRGIKGVLGLWAFIAVIPYIHSNSFAAMGLMLSQWVISLSITLFCLFTLVLNRKSYLRIAGAKWSI